MEAKHHRQAQHEILKAEAARHIDENIRQVLNEPLAPEVGGGEPLNGHPVGRNRLTVGFEKARLQLRDHPAVGQEARNDGHGVAQEGFNQHAFEVARGEHREHEEGRADGNAEAREAQDEQRGDHVDPIDAPRRLGELGQAAVGNVSVIGHPAPDQHGDQHGDRPGPKYPPGPMGIR